MEKRRFGVEPLDGFEQTLMDNSKTENKGPWGRKRVKVLNAQEIFSQYSRY